MSKLFRNASPGALTLQQSVAGAKKRRAERQRQMRQAQELAAEGRGGDTEVAHVARGELVIPRALQNPEVLAALTRAAAAHNIPLEMLSIGNAMNRINPETGMPEFGVMDSVNDFIDKSKRTYGQWFGGNDPDNMQKATISPNSKINDVATAPSYAELGFNPTGPKLGTAVLNDPWAGVVAGVSGAVVRQQAINKFGEGKRTPTDDAGDAWRHTRWNQVLTDWTNPERAKAITDAYERTHDSFGEPARLMDLYNNMVGRSLPKEQDPQNAINQGYIRTRPFK